MPEEQAFMLLCKLMEDQRYLLREMYKANFENLQMRFHQLTCLIQDNLPDVYAHFDDLKVECHMYASQWFLTLFTAKFPLYLVFRIMDIFLYEVSHRPARRLSHTLTRLAQGFNSLFGVALALLKVRLLDAGSCRHDQRLVDLSLNVVQPKGSLVTGLRRRDEILSCQSTEEISKRRSRR